MEELNKGYEFTKAQIAELESLRVENQSLKTELKAARKDADRYRWLRNDPPVWLAVRRFPGETPRGCYLDGRNLDDAIDEAVEQAKGGV